MSSVDQVNDASLVTKGLQGSRSVDFVNALFTLLNDESLLADRVCSTFVSPYVAHQLSQRCLAEHLKGMWNQSRELLLRNPSMRGWTFQFIVEEAAKLLKQLELVKHRHTEQQQVAVERVTLPVRRVYPWTGSLATALRKQLLSFESNDLLVAETFNQGGYDMLSLKKDGDTWTVRALQLTVSQQHDIKTRFMAEAIRDLRDVQRMTITKLEVWMVTLYDRLAAQGRVPLESDFVARWDASDSLSKALAKERDFSFPRTCEVFFINVEDLLSRLGIASPVAPAHPLQ